MNDFGFISDKLEIKFLILYIASRVMGPAPFEVLQELSKHGQCNLLMLPYHVVTLLFWLFSPPKAERTTSVSQ